MELGRISGIARYPVKSLVGENLTAARVDHRGIEGDRLWAVRDPDGKLGSGKSTRRFRRMPGLLSLRSRYEADLTPVVVFPDGRSLRGDAPEVHRALSDHVGRPVTLAREGSVSHFDEGPLHLLTRASLARASQLHGTEVDPRRLRANLVVDTAEDPRFDEGEWVGRTLRVGADVLLRVRMPMPRCVMVGLPQVELPEDGRLLGTIADGNGTELGLVVDVLRPGVITDADLVVAE